MSLEEIVTRYPVHRLEHYLGRAVSRFEPLEHRALLRSQIWHYPGETELDAQAAFDFCSRLMKALRSQYRCEAWPVAGSHPDFGKHVQCSPACQPCLDFDAHGRRLWALACEEIASLEAELATGQAAEEILEGPGWVQHCTEDGLLFRATKPNAMTCSERCRKARSRRLAAAKAASRQERSGVPEPALVSSGAAR